MNKDIISLFLKFVVHQDILKIFFYKNFQQDGQTDVIILTKYVHFKWSIYQKIGF